MKRRQLLWGSAAAVAAIGGAAAWFKPGDAGLPHDSYFSALNDVMKRHGPGYPVVIVDINRLNRNIDVVTEGIESPKKYRAVVKSLPSMGLLNHVMHRSGSDGLMVFHQPFLNLIADQFPQSDVLLGKPMPVNAVNTYYHRQNNPGFNSERQVQWLVDSTRRLQQYLQLAKTSGVRMRVNFEIDVGLHRGGFASPEESTKALELVGRNPDHLIFSGLMGYEPHLAGVADSLAHPAATKVLSSYEMHLGVAKSHGYDPATLTLNGAGSHTIRLYQKDRMLNDLSAGSGLVKPGDFDTMHLDAAVPAAFIATPVLKHYSSLQIPGDGLLPKALPMWDPNTSQLFFIYGGYWKAKPVSPPGMQDWMYKSTNQAPLMASNNVELGVDDYVFFRPDQSEQLFLEFPEIVVVDDGEIVDRWNVFRA